MSDGTKAVFLSYASEDAESAKKICEALRAAGVEVWFDQNELVGGDAWDAKIRGQLCACALFIPVISRHTQARLEGYFRIEWKLAAQRTHAMAEAKPFLLPAVIDATHDAAAHAPSEFRAVQWTRLPGGKTPPTFCARVRRLLEVDAAQSSPFLTGSITAADYAERSGKFTPPVTFTIRPNNRPTQLTSFIGRERATPEVARILAGESASEPFRIRLLTLTGPGSTGKTRLALQVAAARTRLLPAEQLLDRVHDRFRLLTGGNRTALPRQQTLRALVDWSYDLLSDQERMLFDRLPVFAGGWTLEAAEAVCTDGERGMKTGEQGPTKLLGSEHVLDLLGRRLEKSMVVAERSADGAARY
ncbi:MAG: TIR domain-containing protein [Verrucomicrobia bacterium]|nr:TIR domain-containing protein [Verrucomicrobiota bacterium]